MWTRGVLATAMFGSMCGVIAVASSLAHGGGQDGRARREPEPARVPFVRDALKSCGGCHRDPTAKNDLCRMIEYHFWENSDPHRTALDWLDRNKPSARRAWEIGGRLKIDPTTSTTCTGCHSVPGIVRRGNPDPLEPTKDGVTCVACHGAFREDLGDWRLAHQSPGDPTPIVVDDKTKTWEDLTRSEKAKHYGMVDLWDPVIRARACLSCHIGDPDPKQCKTITHEIYAAGHPPLPGIEVTSFLEEEPKHWLYLRCKTDAAKRRLEFNRNRFEQAEQVAATGLVALQRSLELFVAEARDAANWPEFALYDCNACHHGLERNFADRQPWRQRRGSVGQPGRPTEPNWSLALVPLGLIAADPDPATVKGRIDELDDKLKHFHRALTARPFGDPKATANAASTLANWLDSPIGELQERARGKPGQPVVDADCALTMLQTVVELSQAEIHDYDSARQLAWAYRTLYLELLDRARRNANQGGPRWKAMADRAIQVAPLLDHLDKELVLSFRKRGGVEPGACPAPNQLMAFPAKPDQEPIIGETLKGRLKQSESFDPERFQKRIKALAELLPKARP